jgi:hypothetical protein
MFVPDNLKTNAYRTLRLSANATLSDVHTAAASMRRAAMLGVSGTTEEDAPELGEVSRTEADIRTAVGRLQNPVQRLSDRLFWFHLPKSLNTNERPRLAEVVQGQSDRAAWGHDQALLGLLAALAAGVGDAGVPIWTEALRAWNGIVCDDDYWALTLALEERGSFEPAALPSEGDALRKDAVMLAAAPIVMAARDALARNDTSTVRRITVALEDLADTGPWALVAREDVVSPAVERFHALCEAVREEFGSKIVREPSAGRDNKSFCDAGLERFRSEIEPALRNLVQLVPPGNEAAQRSRESAALCLSGIAADYTWADDFITAEKLNEEALRLAQETLGALRIEEGLAQIREAARKQRVFGSLKPVSSAPTLSTINGFGFTLYGKSDFDEETRSHVATYYFVGLFIPVFPIARYRVIDQGGRRYSFLGKLPLRKGDRWHLGITAAAIVVLLLGGIISSQNSTSSYVPSTNPAYRPQSSQLSELKVRIDSGRSRITMLETKLKPAFDELNILKTQMEPLASELKSLDDKRKAGIYIDISDYNSKVDRYNSLLSRQRSLIAANSTDFQTYDDLVKQDSELVARYNAIKR